MISYLSSKSFNQVIWKNKVQIQGLKKEESVQKRESGFANIVPVRVFHQLQYIAHQCPAREEFKNIN